MCHPLRIVFARRLARVSSASHLTQPPPHLQVQLNISLSFFLLLTTIFTPRWWDLLISVFVLLHNLQALVQLDFRAPTWVWFVILMEVAFLSWSYSVNIDLPGGFI
jgi:hypothetical protein